MFDRVKKYIRIVCLFSPHPNARNRPSNRPCRVPTYGLYFTVVLRFPVNFPLPTGTLPITIAGFMAYHVTLAELKGCTAHFDKVNGAAIFELCRKEQLRTMQKLEEVTGLTLLA
jgi:hypothetical protein